jgi:hypothetical protein
MSNHLAIATVTATLGDLVHKAAEKALSSTVALHFGRPTAASTGATERKVHVYLYQVTPNAALRNNDLPTRNSEGGLTRRPQAALDLHYLLSFFGDDRTLEPDRMLGAVARDLHARPVLSAQAISDAIASRAELTGSDLAAAFEQVKFVPAQLSLDEMSKLWSVMVQTPHVLSVAYQGTVVQIDAEESAGTALPVLKRGTDDHGVDTRIGPFPRLDSWWAGAASAALRAPRPPSFPVAQLGVRLLLEGSNLGGDTVTLHFAHPRLPVQALELASDDRDLRQLGVDLPDDVPRAVRLGGGRLHRVRQHAARYYCAVVQRRADRLGSPCDRDSAQPGSQGRWRHRQPAGQLPTTGAAHPNGRSVACRP